VTYVSASEVRDLCGISPDEAGDWEIENHIPVAEEIVSKILGKTFGTGTIEEKHFCYRRIILGKKPVISIEYVKYGSTELRENSDFHVNYENGIVVFHYELSPYVPVYVKYSYGVEPTDFERKMMAVLTGILALSSRSYGEQVLKLGDFMVKYDAENGKIRELVNVLERIMEQCVQHVF